MGKKYLSIKMLDLDKLPHNKNGNINWKASIGRELSYLIGEDSKEHKIKILGYMKDCHYKLEVMLENGETFDISTSDLAKGRFAKRLGAVANVYKYKIGDIVKNLLILDYCIINKYDCVRSGYLVRCVFDNYEYEIRSDLLENNDPSCRRCSVCSGRVVIDGINSIYDTDPELVKWFENEEDSHAVSRHSNQVVNLICPYCGRRMSVRPCNIYKNEEPSCACKNEHSYAEKVFACLLRKIQQKYIYQLSKKTFSWCKNYRYDFYFEIDSQRYIVELDGGLGHGNVNYKGEKDPESKILDAKKENIARDNGVDVIRIDVFYRNNDRFSFIKNSIINSRLSTLFDFSEINWKEICVECESPDFIQVCKLYKEGYFSASKIQNRFPDVSRTSIFRYLHKGDELGLISYDGTKAYTEYCNNYPGIYNGRSIPIKVYNEDNCIGLFHSLSSFSKLSESILGINIDRKIVSKCLKENKKYNESISFSYAATEEYLDYLRDHS